MEFNRGIFQSSFSRFSNRILILKEFCISEAGNSVSKAVMNDTNRLVQKWSEIGEFVLVKVSSVGLVIPRAIISYAIYFATNAKNEAFELPMLFWWEIIRKMYENFTFIFKILNSICRVPFEWKTPLGYLVAITLQYMMVVYCFIFLFDCFSFGIECFAFPISMIAKKVKDDLKLINVNAVSDRNRSLTLKLVADFIHSWKSWV